MSSEIVLITGANTGLGFQIVRALCRSDHPYTILLGGRSKSKAEQAVEDVKKEYPKTASQVVSIQVDIEDDDSIQAAFSEVQSKFKRVDVLINNAGAQLDPQFTSGKMTMRQMWNQSWNVNVTGTQIMTHTFVPLLLEAKNPRLLFIASGTSTLAGTENLEIFVNKPPPKGWPKDPSGVPAYRSSKTGMNMMMREWFRILKGDGVKVWCISPGYLATNLGPGQDFNKKMGAIDPAIAADFVKSVVEGQRDSDVGKVVLSDKVQDW